MHIVDMRMRSPTHALIPHIYAHAPTHPCTCAACGSQVDANMRELMGHLMGGFLALPLHAWSHSWKPVLRSAFARSKAANKVHACLDAAVVAVRHLSATSPSGPCGMRPSLPSDAITMWKRLGVVQLEKSKDQRKDDYIERDEFRVLLLCMVRAR